MKRKQIAAPRRMFLVAAKFKTGAGAHRKSNKAMRRQMKMSVHNSMVEQLAFNQLVVGSSPTGRTKNSQGCYQCSGSTRLCESRSMGS